MVFASCATSSVWWNCKKKRRDHFRGRFILLDARDSLWDLENILYHPAFFSVLHYEIGGKKTHIFFLSFVCFVIYFGSSVHIGFSYPCLYTACSLLGPSSMYIWKYFHEYRCTTKFNNRNLHLLTNITYI